MTITFLVLFLAYSSGYGRVGDMEVMSFSTWDACVAAKEAIISEPGDASVVTATCIPGGSTERMQGDDRN